jgi:rhodanese-related sulfurtransferase
MAQITVNELKQILDNNTSNNFIVLDVRTNVEHDTVKIPGVYNLELGELKDNVDMLKTYDKVYLHCQSGNRSGQGCKELESLGLTNVVDVSGGISAWQEQNFGVIKKHRMPIMNQVLTIAGSLVLTGIGLSFINVYFLLLSTAVSIGLMYAGLSGNCLMAKILSKAPWNQVKVDPLPWQKNKQSQKVVQSIS